ncbi:protein P200-like [Homalodisca vitripennis]|uniref:protein P200-like n=1 Tax=Homalodisca vitripennis TaxID=197043 RepID=UPI001EEABFE4|nr:protein P200-like [Homalodisca vitripennis]
MIFDYHHWGWMNKIPVMIYSRYLSLVITPLGIRQETKIEKKSASESESIIDKVTRLNNSSLTRGDRLYESPRLSRNADISRSGRLTNTRLLPKYLTRSSSFNITSSYSQKPETCFPSERRSSVVTRPLTVYRANVPSRVGSRSQSPQSSYMRSKSPLRVVDDIFKKYLINYDKRYLSDPISESKYGKYLYPPTTERYDDYRSTGIARSKSFSSPRTNFKSGCHENYSYLSPRDNINLDCYNDYRTNQNLYSKQPKHTVSNFGRSFPQPSYANDWKDWNHYRDRYEYLPETDENYAQNNTQFLDDLDHSKYRQNTTYDHKNTFSHDFDDKLSLKYVNPSSYSQLHSSQTTNSTLHQNSLYLKPKSPIIRSGSEEAFMNNHYHYDNDSELSGKPEYDDSKVKESTRTSQNPKRVSFSNEFLYDDKSDPDINLDASENPVSPDEMKQLYESQNKDYTSLNIGKVMLAPDLIKEDLKQNLVQDNNLESTTSEKKKAKFSNSLLSGRSEHLKDQNKKEKKFKETKDDFSKFEDESLLITGKDSTSPLSEEKSDELEINENNSETSSVLENAKNYLKRRSSLFPSDDLIKKLEANEEINPYFANSDENNYAEIAADSHIDPKIQDSENLRQEIITEKPSLLPEVKHEDNAIIPTEEQNQGNEISMTKQNIEKDETSLLNQTVILGEVQDSERPTIQTDLHYSEVDSRKDRDANFVIMNSDIVEDKPVPIDESQIPLNEAKQHSVPLEDKEELFQQPDEPYLIDPNQYEQTSQQVYKNQELQPQQYVENKIQQQSDLSDYQGIEYNQQPIYEDTNLEQNVVPDNYIAQTYQGENVYEDNVGEYGNVQFDQTQGQYDQYEQQSAETYPAEEYVQQDVAGYNETQVYDTEGYDQRNIPKEYQQTDIYPSDYQQPVEYGVDNYEQQSAQDLQQPVQEQFQADNYIEQAQYGQGFEGEGGDQYIEGQYPGKPSVQEYPPAEYEGEYPQEYPQQPIQYEEGYQDPTQDIQNVPEQYDATYEKDPQYQYEQQEGNFDQTNIPEQYDQYQQNLPQQYEQYDQQQPDQYDQYDQQTTEQYDQYDKQQAGQYDQYEQQQSVQYNDQYQGEPDQYGNYDYGYDQQSGAQQGYTDDQVPYTEQPQVYGDDMSATYGDIQQPYSEDQEIYGDQQQSYGSPEYLPQDIDSKRLEDAPAQPEYVPEIHPNVDQLHEPDSTTVNEDGSQPFPATVDSTKSGPVDKAKVAPDLSHVLESDSETAQLSQPAVSQEDSSDFDFSAGKK